MRLLSAVLLLLAPLCAAGGWVRRTIVFVGYPHGTHVAARPQLAACAPRCVRPGACAPLPRAGWVGFTARHMVIWSYDSCGHVYPPRTHHIYTNVCS